MVKEIINKDKDTKEKRYQTENGKLVEREATPDEIAEHNNKEQEVQEWVKTNGQKLVEEIKKIEIIPYSNNDFNEDEKLIQSILKDYIGLAKNINGELTERHDDKGIISPENFDKAKELIDRLQIIIDDRREKYKKLYSADSAVDDYLNDFTKNATSEGISSTTSTKGMVKDQYPVIDQIKKQISSPMNLLDTTISTAKIEHNRISTRLLSSQIKQES